MDFTMNILDYFSLGDFIYDKDCTKYFLGIVLVFFIQLPICARKSLAKLHILSFIGVTLLFYVIIVAIFEFPFYFKKNYSPEKIEYIKLDFNIIEVICVFFFAFGNHTSILNALKEIKNKTDSRIMTLAKFTFYSEFFLYLIIMLVGYFSMYDQTSDIFINREDQSIFMIVGKIFYVFTLTCNVGLYFYMLRPTLEFLFNDEYKLKGFKYNILFI